MGIHANRDSDCIHVIVILCRYHFLSECGYVMSFNVGIVMQATDVLHSSEDAPPTSECRKRKRYECKECGRQVKKVSHLEQHLLTHSSQVCSRCYVS